MLSLLLAPALLLSCVPEALAAEPQMRLYNDQWTVAVTVTDPVTGQTK